MTALERHALEKMIKEASGISTCGPSYDENFRRVSDGDDPSLLNDPRYRQGWERCAAGFKLRLQMLLDPSTTPKDLIKYAGRPGRKGRRGQTGGAR